MEGQFYEYGSVDRSMAFKSEKRRTVPTVTMASWGYPASNSVQSPLLYCPFCAAPISFKKHLDIRVVEELDPTPRYGYSYEAVR